MNLEKIRTRQASPLKSIDISQEVNDSLAKAKEFIEQENFDQAENLYIKVIELDRSNVEAYSGLVEVYLEKKDYKKARETCRYCLKLLNKASKNAPANGQKHQVAELCADLGSIYQLEEKYDQAITSFNKSLELEPNNPRFLDLLLKISIIVKRKDLAISTFKILKKADPDNQKLVELKSEVDAIEPEQL